MSIRQIVLLAIIVRFIAALLFGNPYDFEIWRSTVSVVYSFHINTYFWWSQGPISLIGILASALPIPGLAAIGVHLPIPLQDLSLHLFFIVGDLLVGLALTKLIHDSKTFSVDAWQKRALLVWAVFPGFWWIGAAHGQTDTWIPATILLSIVFLHQKRPLIAGVILGLGGGIIYVPLVVAPTLGIYMIKRDGWRRAIIFAVTTTVTLAISMIPMLLTLFQLGHREGTLLFLRRNEWWSVGALAPRVAGQLGLTSVINSPYPLLLALANHSAIALNIIMEAPVVGSIVAIVAVPILYALLGRNGGTGLPSIDAVLFACATTLLVAGGLSSQATDQRLYWSLPLLLVLAARRQSISAFAGVCVYSWLYLLPEFNYTSPALYLLSSFSHFAYNSVIDSLASSWSGFGLNPFMASIFGALLLPMGLVCLVLVIPKFDKQSPVLSAPQNHLSLRRRVGMIFTSNVATGIVLALILSLLIARHNSMLLDAVLGLSLPLILGALFVNVTFYDLRERQNWMRISLAIVSYVALSVVLLSPIANTISQWGTG